MSAGENVVDVREPEPTEPALPMSRRLAATIGTGIAILVVSLDGTIVGTAMPKILADLQGLDLYAWVTTAFLVTSTLVMPIAGKLGDLFGRKPLITIGLVGFIVCSWLCGTAGGVTALVVYRAAQGLFGGVLTAITFAVVADIWPLRQRVILHGIFGGLIGLASAGGPVLGGWIADEWGWRWIFYVNVPVGLPALLLTALFVPYVATHRSWRDIDLAGCLSLAVVLVPLLVALSLSSSHGWGSTPVLGLLVVSAVALPVLLWLERRNPDPIVPLGLFRRRVFTIAMVLAGLSAVGLYGLAVYVPLLYQGVLGRTATNSGTLLTPLLIGMLVTAPLAGQLIGRIPRYRYIGTAGLLAMTAGTLLLTTVQKDTPGSHVIADLVLLGAGMGLVWPLSTAVVQAAMDRRVVGVATAQVNFWRSLGGTVAVVVLGTILTAGFSQGLAERTARIEVPPALQRSLGDGGGDLQSLVDTKRLAQLRSALPADQRDAFDQIVHASRLALTDALHQAFLVAALLLATAAVASLFLPEAPIPKRRSELRTARGEVTRVPPSPHSTPPNTA